MRCDTRLIIRHIGLVTPALLGLSLLVSACDGDDPESIPRAEVDGRPADVTAPSADELPDAEALLAESVQALGGADKFAAMESYYSEAEVDMGALGVKGEAKMWWKGGDFYGETLLPGFGNTRMGGRDGVIWAEDPINGMRVVSGKEADQTAWSTSVCLPCEWKRFFRSAKTLGLKQEGEHKLAEVELRSHEDHAVVFEIDLATKLPHAQRFEQMSPLGAMPVRITFEDYRTEHGLTLSYKQTLNAKLTQFSSTTTRFDVNVPIDDGRFQVPGGANEVDMARPETIETKPPVKAEGDAKATAQEKP